MKDFARCITLPPLGGNGTHDISSEISDCTVGAVAGSPAAVQCVARGQKVIMAFSE